jgi:hypothetical protein
LRGIVVLAFKSDEKGKGERIGGLHVVSDEDFAKMLQKIRRMSATCNASESNDPESVRFYRDYVERETIICQYIHDLLGKIKEDTNGKKGSVMMEAAFNVHELSRKLKLNSTWAQDWANSMCMQLGNVVVIQDLVPRSQITFTLQLVLRNSHFILHKMGKHSCHQSDQSQEVPSGEVDEREMQYDIFADESPLQQLVSADAERQVPFSGNENRQIAAHEHITQKKFNKESLNIVTSMAERKRYKNTTDWVRDFEDSDNEEQDAIDTSRQLFQNETGYDSDDAAKADVNQSRRDRPLGPESSIKETYTDDELDFPLRTEYDTGREALFPSSWGYGAPVLSGFCVTSVFAEHIPLYHVQVCLLSMTWHTYLDHCQPASRLTFEDRCRSMYVA